MTSWVYFIREGDVGPIKIGVTDRSPVGRLNSLQHGNPRPLRVIGMIAGNREDEVAWHRRFADVRLEREWFSASDALLAAIKAECITGDRLEKLVEHYRRGERRLGPRLRALHVWMETTGRTPESLAAEIGWQELRVRNALLGRNNPDGLGLYLASAICRVSKGEFRIEELVADSSPTKIYQRMLAKQNAARQAVSA